MKVIKKFIAVLCSATLVLAAPLTAFAAEPDPVASAEGTAGTAGAGNVLSYNFDTVVVPTTIQITFNPQGLAIAKRAGETAVTNQIVSLNYGIASKASQDKKVIVKFAANTSLNGESSDVEFVDATAKITAQADPTDDSDVGAPSGSHRIFLQVAPATAVPTYYKDAATTDGVAFEVTGERGSKEDNITAGRLSDVVMTASTATDAVQTFKKATGTANNSAYAVLGFKLDKATYAAKEDLSFETTAAQVADKMEINALGTTGVTGFTFTGSMNTNTDWTKANLSAIAITPIYELADAGTEAAVASTAGVITLTEAADLAEPAKPMTADGVAAAAFKTAHATVLALTAENVTGDAEELEAIETAITAFEALSSDVQAILAEDSITAESLAALKAASEAKGVVALTTTYDSSSSTFKIAMPDGVTIADVSDIANFKVNGTAITVNKTLNSTGNIIRIERLTLKTAMQAASVWPAEASDELEITFTVGDVNYATTTTRQ